MQQSLVVAWLRLTGCVAGTANNLVDLGFTNGRVLRGPGPSQSVYFPFPVNSQGATLDLSFTVSAALNRIPAPRVWRGNVPLATVPDTANGKLQIQAPARFTQGGVLQLSFVADQTVGDESRR